MAAKQSCPGSMSTGGMDCTLDGAEVDEKGVLHCSYTCTPRKAQASDGVKAQLKDLGARAQAAAIEMNAEDPASVQRVNAELKRVHADLVAFAKAHNLELIKKEYANESPRRRS